MGAVVSEVAAALYPSAARFLLTINTIIPIRISAAIAAMMIIIGNQRNRFFPVGSALAAAAAAVSPASVD